MCWFTPTHPPPHCHRASPPCYWDSVSIGGQMNATCWLSTGCSEGYRLPAAARINERWALTINQLLCPVSHLKIEPVAQALIDGDSHFPCSALECAVLVCLCLVCPIFHFVVLVRVHFRLSPIQSDIGGNVDHFLRWFGTLFSAH